MPYFPLISVIVPVYNVERYLNECVDSILLQTYPNLEILLIDDGSKDRSPQICDEYAAAHSHIKAVHKRNGGASSARNVGIEMAKGEYLAFLDSDDIFDPEMYSELYKILQETGADMVTSRFKSLNGTRVIRNNLSHDVSLTGHKLAEIMFEKDLGTSACASIIKRDVVGNTRFPEGISNEDFVFMLDLYLKDPKIYISKNSYYYYRYNEESTSSRIYERTFDLLTNAFDAEHKVSTLSKDLKAAARVYKVRRHIDMAFRLRRDNFAKQYPEEMKACYDVMHQNFWFFLFTNRVTFKYKIKMMLNLLHIPVKEQREVIEARKQENLQKAI